MLSKKGEPQKVNIPEFVNQFDESKTVFGSNAVFKGELNFQHTLCIDGEFEGKLTTDNKLIVAEEGVVQADIDAGIVICKGKIRGNIIASQRVEIHSTGKILGDVLSPSLMIEVGAVFNGKSYMPEYQREEVLKEGLPFYLKR